MKELLRDALTDSLKSLKEQYDVDLSTIKIEVKNNFFIICFFVSKTNINSLESAENRGVAKSLLILLNKS